MNHPLGWTEQRADCAHTKASFASRRALQIPAITVAKDDRTKAKKQSLAKANQRCELEKNPPSLPGPPNVPGWGGQTSLCLRLLDSLTLGALFLKTPVALTELKWALISFASLPFVFWPRLLRERESF